MLDLKITGGQVLDGTGAPPVRADVGVAGDRIADVGNLSAAEARTSIDAAGRWILPGFIDVHSHSDSYLLIEPSARSKLYQGVTTEIVGNCGASAAPRIGGYPMPSDWREKKYPGEWRTVAEYRRLLDGVKPAVNVVLLIGHNALRAGVVGYDNRAATADELQTMIAWLERSIEEGGVGLSTGLIYPPGMFAPREEIEALARVVARRGGIYTSHMRSEGARLLEALDETIGVGRAAGVRVQVSHLKTSGRKNWHLVDAALERIRAAQAGGVEVAADRYPYTASSTDLDVVLPDWAAAGGREAILGRLRDPAQRKRIRDALTTSRDAAYWQSVMVGSTHHPDHERFKGLSLPDIARELGVEPVDAVLQLIDKDELRTGGIFFGMSEDNLWKILREPWVMIGSDASVRAPDGPLSKDHPHPRGYGAFARFLRAALDGKTVGLPEAVRKMTSLPADQFRLRDRGRIAKGKLADVLVVDPIRVREAATFGKPHQLAEGFDAVIVNGVTTLSDGRLTGQRAGRFL